MKKLLLLFALTYTLFAQNPNSYAALGDVIYNDIEKFEQLKSLPAMSDLHPTIDAYVKEAKAAKKMGFAVDAKEKGAEAKVYLKTLRKLSIERDSIILGSRAHFKEAISDEDGETINSLVGFGVIQPTNYKKELISYYEEYHEDQNLSYISPLYDNYCATLAPDTNRTAETQSQREQRQKEELIERMRAKNKQKEEALERSVEEEKQRGKKKVLNEQKEALGL